MTCNDFDYDDDGRRQDCTAEATGKHGLCADHRDKTILWARGAITEALNNMRFYLNDAKAHNRYGSHRGNVAARVREARIYGHQALRLKRELRRLEAAS